MIELKKCSHMQATGNADLLPTSLAANSEPDNQVTIFVPTNDALARFDTNSMSEDELAAVRTNAPLTFRSFSPFDQ